MKKHYLIILSLFTLLLSSCDYKSNELTAKELASATEVKWWNLKIPGGHEKDFLSVHFSTPNKKITSHCGSSGWRGGENIKVFLFEDNKKMLSYSIVGKNVVFHGSIPNESIDYKGAKINRTVGSTIKLGDILIKKSKSNSIDGTINNIKDEEIGITVTFSKK